MLLNNNFKQEKYSLLLLIFFTCAFAYPLSALGLTAESPCISIGWPSDKSELEPDPALIRGTLGNGMRYVFLPNDEPEDRVAMYLNIQAGSLNERDDQRGLAHYLEHMLFNGTENFAPGELVEFFNSIGMSFGADTNAHTSYDETVYKIYLPNGSKKLLTGGLKVMADYARGALLLEDEIERERGIILAEKRSRDSASYRAFVESNAFSMAGTRLVDRLVIGTEGLIKGADRTLLKDYYDMWYRPENMILVVAGKADQQQLLPLIEQYLGDLAAPAVTPACYSFGELSHEGIKPYYFYSPDLGATEVTIKSMWNIEPENDSKAVQVRDIHRYAAGTIIQNRLQRLLEEGNNGFTSSAYYSGEMYDRVGMSVITARTDSKGWEKSLKTIESVLRQALEYGLSNEELQRVKKDLITSLEQEVETKQSRGSRSLAMAIIRSLNSNRVFMSPEQEQELYGDIVQHMSVADVNMQLRKDWQHNNRLILLSGNSQLDEDRAQTLIKETYIAATQNEVREYEVSDTKRFPYLKIPAPKGDGVVAAYEHKDIGVRQIRLANNSIINIKQTDYEPNIVRLVLNVGEGAHSAPTPGMAMLGEDVINDSGTGQMSPADFGDALSGTTISVNFHIGPESFSYSGKSARSELNLLLQVLYHLINDPGVRETSFERAKESADLLYGKLLNDIKGALRGEVQRFLAGGNEFIGLPQKQYVDDVDFGELERWLLGSISTGSFELSIIGDLDPLEVEQQVLELFGALDKREPVKRITDQLQFPEGERIDRQVDTDIEKSAVIVAWPTTDFSDVHLTRRLHVLARLLGEKLREEIREKLGVSYSPSVYSAPGTIFENYGKIVAQVTVEPGTEQMVSEAIKTIVQDIHDNGVTESELEAVLKPLQTSLKDTVRSNSYWLGSVMSLSGRYPDKLVWPASMVEDYGAITTEEIGRIAAKYLDNKKMAAAIVRPQKSADTKEY